MQPLPFFKPSIGQREIDAVTRVLQSGMLTGGSEVAAFEREFLAYLGASADLQAVAVGSATAGLHLCLHALGIKPGDEVIVPTLTFTATAEVVERMGAVPVFCDIEPDTFCMDPVHMQALITPRTRAVMPVHHSGRPARMQEIFAIARASKLLVIEDAAHALPARHNGQLIGTLQSDATVFSFYANKTITTGDGGMIVTRDKAMAERCAALRLHGIYRGSVEDVQAGILYDVKEAGYKYNMTDMAAALGRVQLTRCDEFYSQRKSLVTAYRTALQNMPLLLPADEGEDESAWHLFIIRFTGEQANHLRALAIKAFQQAGIGFSIHYRPLHQHSHWRNASAPAACPQSDLFFATSLSLPLYPGMTEADIHRVADTLEKVLA